MPLDSYAEQGILGLYFGDAAFAAAATLYAGLVIQLGTLTTALTAGTAITSLACTGTTAYAVASGDTILVGTGSTTQAFVTSALASSGASSISVVSTIANATYATTTPFIRCGVYATAQEPSGSAYARVSVGNSSTNFNTAAGTSPANVTNKTAITFPQASGSWGTVAGFLFADNTTPGTGHEWIYGMLNAAQAVSSGNTPSFAASALTLTLY